MTLVQWAIHEKLTRTVALQRAQSAQEPMNEFSSDCLTTICFLTLITLCNLKRKAGRGRGVSCGSNLLKGTTGVKPWKAYGGEIPSGFVQPPGLSRAPEPAGNGPRQPRGVVHWDYFWNILPPEIRENLENQVPLFWCLYFKGGHFWPTIVSFLWATRLRTSETMETETESTVVVGFNLIVSEACLFPTSWYVSSNQSGTQISLLPGELQMDFLIISRSGGGHRLCQLLQLASL